MAVMKKLLLIFACLGLFAACQENNPDDPGKKDQVDVTGVWELVSVATKANVGSVTVNVYIDFAADNSFTLYQKIGEGRYTKFSGSYKLDKETGALSGSYSGGSAWGPYTAARSGGSLTLTSAGGKEVDSYKKLDSIPSSVTENVY
jgi:hypothetical protein